MNRMIYDEEKMSDDDVMLQKIRKILSEKQHDKKTVTKMQLRRDITTWILITELLENL